MGSESKDPSGTPSRLVTARRTLCTPARLVVASNRTTLRAPGPRRRTPPPLSVSSPSVRTCTRTSTGWSRPLTSVTPRGPESLDRVTAGGASISILAEVGAHRLLDPLGRADGQPGSLAVLLRQGDQQLVAHLRLDGRHRDDHLLQQRGGLAGAVGRGEGLGTELLGDVVVGVGEARGRDALGRAGGDVPEGDQVEPRLLEVGEERRGVLAAPHRRQGDDERRGVVRLEAQGRLAEQPLAQREGVVGRRRGRYRPPPRRCS